MVAFSTLLVAVSAAALHVNALPLTKRVAQVISDSTTQWEAACDAAGGGQQCNPVAVAAFSTLLAAPGPCEQQDAGDSMINLAKQLNNNAQMISLAQVFVQQPRNSPSSQAVPYCQSAPNNTELNGLYQCQFQSVNEQTFVGGLAVGTAGTIPFGLSAPVSPAGSCPANPSGPIPDGQQLVNITQNPGVGNAGASSGAAPSAAPSASSGAASSAAAPSASAPASEPSDSSCADSSSADTPSSAMPTASASGSASAASPAASGFQLSNGQAAQTLNAQFAALSTNATCSAGDDACVDGGFAQCVGGQYVVQPCAATLACFALPLVNKAGTSLACTTQADAAARIAATGAGGGVAGAGSS